MPSNTYQSLVDLLSNILEAYTTAFFIVDPKNRQLHLVAVQSLSKHVTADASLPMEQSGILSQVHKSGQTVHLDKLPEVTTELTNTLPFYIAGESHIKGLFATPVGKGLGVLYIDTKYAWGFSDKQQKWILEIARLLHELVEHQECVRQQQSYTRILDFFYRLDQTALQGCGLEEYCQVVVTECARLMDIDYAFLAFQDNGEPRYRLLAATPNVPANLLDQSFSLKRGLIGWTFQNQKVLQIPKLHPEATDHYLCIPGEPLPHTGSLWGLPAKMTLGHGLVLALLSSAPRQWPKEEQLAIQHLFHILHLLLEQVYYKEHCDLLEAYDLSSGLLNAPTFETEVKETLSTAMRSSIPFTVALVQFEPWQLLYTKAAPNEVRELQQQLAAALRDALPPDMVLGQLAENRFGLLIPEGMRTRFKQAPAFFNDLLQQTVLSRIERIQIHPYLSSVDFPHDVTRTEELWPVLHHRLFAAFQAKNKKV